MKSISKILILLFGVVLFVSSITFIHFYVNKDIPICKEEVAGNLTYSYYNYTTQEVTYNVTDIPIYSKVCSKTI